MGKIMTLGIASFVMQVAATLVTVGVHQVVGVYGALDAIGVESALGRHRRGAEEPRCSPSCRLSA